MMARWASAFEGEGKPGIKTPSRRNRHRASACHHAIMEACWLAPSGRALRATDLRHRTAEYHRDGRGRWHAIMEFAILPRTFRQRKTCRARQHDGMHRVPSCWRVEQGAQPVERPGTEKWKR
jgi:hypothetical protein